MPGATIAVVAPAGPVDPSELDPGIEALKSLGYKVVPGEHIYEKKGYLAGDDTQRLKDLNWAISDSAVDAVICARGGYGCMRLLPLVDYKSFSRTPKVFTGFSDVTALLHALYSKCGVITFHGPMVKNFRFKDDANLNALLQTITSSAPWQMRFTGARVLQGGSAHGVIIGGNLSIVASLFGTPYFPESQDFILFLEDTDEPLYRIDRMLTSLKLRGCLEGARGIIAGKFHSSGTEDEVDQVLIDTLGDLGIPIISGAPFGHGELNLSFPIGLRVTLDTDAKRANSEQAPVY